MSSSSHDILGLEVILEELARRYEFDAVGRIVRSRGDGVLPRFVLGRAVEGCVWRFCVGLDPDLIVVISRLAAREPGRAVGGGEMPSPPPERLVMIERHLSVAQIPGSTSHELLVVDGHACAELWTIRDAKHTTPTRLGRAPSRC